MDRKIKKELEYWKNESNKQKQLRIELEKRDQKIIEHEKVVEYCKRVCEEYKRCLNEKI